MMPWRPGRRPDDRCLRRDRCRNGEPGESRDLSGESGDKCSRGGKIGVQHNVLGCDRLRYGPELVVGGALSLLRSRRQIDIHDG
jgi:hypothetical protein